ncbi:hypothetical protein QBC37DRAFT_434061 [Rhypophila decipiens]|uniref:Uncharacterized protein n=1 Tax=Rhypophila decipiens TaxID=261697 RepID=A0AAN6XUZ0_9PEZI|nr:hypothetical protein QBC37DRAFT_434061 [Rhypophila decipiens]
MTGNGGLSCTIFFSASDILKRWPFLEYLPRPEPPREYAKAHGHWKREYAQWKGLKCSRQKGAYFCRRHGKWITCVELQAGEARPQQEERDEGYRCPASHYDWEQIENEFYERQCADLEDFAQRIAGAKTAAQASNDPSTDQELESEFDRLDIGSSSRGDQQDYYGQETEPYYPNQPSYAESSNYSQQPGYSEDASQYRDKHTSGRSGSRYSSKSHKSQGSRSHISRDSHSSKSTWATQSTTASSPPPESHNPPYYTQPIPTYLEHPDDNPGYDPATYYESKSYAGDEDEPAIQPRYYR